MTLRAALQGRPIFCFENPASGAASAAPGPIWVACGIRHALEKEIADVFRFW